MVDIFNREMIPGLKNVTASGNDGVAETLPSLKNVTASGNVGVAEMLPSLKKVTASGNIEIAETFTSAAVASSAVTPISNKTITESGYPKSTTEVSISCSSKPLDTTGSVGVPETSSAQKTQEKIENSEVTSKWPDDHHISKQIDKFIMDLIFVDMLPYNIVEGAAFKRIEFANPTEPNQYTKKTEQFFRTSLMPETFNKVHQKVITILESSKFLSITIHFADSPDNLYSLLCFTGNFVHGSSRKKVILGASVLKVLDKHRICLDLYVAEKLSEIVTNFKLKQKIDLAICNSQLNMYTMKLCNITALECVAQNLQRVISGGVFSDKQIKKVITKCLGIVKHFEHSKEAKQNFKFIQEKLSLDKLAFVLDMNKTWLSTYLTMESLNEQKTAVEVYSKEHGDIIILAAEEWDLLNDIVETLESFYEAYIELSADNASVSLVIPVINMLAATIEDDAAEHFKDKLKQAFNNTFKFIETSPFLIVATLLDPRFKGKCLNETQIQIAEKEMADFLNQSRSTAVIKRGKKPKNKLWDKHDNMLLTMKTDMTFKKEFALYMEEPLSPRKSNIYEYWLKNSYEHLKTIALKYILASPTTVESEEMFAAAGRLYADRSDNLKKMEAEQYLFCHYNIKLFDFDY